ncbi:hypothetical protein BDP27DRAFT_1436013 [Rhodocollybia butyracea]|uniref:Uncharacterized protein n=1 Tax=Rhodocollybia butyracea TaxID=206335 RepID=A0A9P5TV69_9AGAR|nr:hypothetical protein BDP27DRAFT_1436013 [Rhodocollybia butyracea]
MSFDVNLNSDPLPVPPLIFVSSLPANLSVLTGRIALVGSEYLGNMANPNNAAPPYNTPR